MTADLARMTAAQAKAEEVAAELGSDGPLRDGPRIRITFSDPIENRYLATAFVAYEVPVEGPAEPPVRRPRLRLVPNP